MAKTYNCAGEWLINFDRGFNYEYCGYLTHLKMGDEDFEPNVFAANMWNGDGAEHEDALEASDGEDPRSEVIGVIKSLTLRGSYQGISVSGIVNKEQLTKAMKAVTEDGIMGVELGWWIIKRGAPEEGEAAAKYIELSFVKDGFITANIATEETGTPRLSVSDIMIEDSFMQGAEHSMQAFTLDVKVPEAEGFSIHELLNEQPEHHQVRPWGREAAAG